MSACACMYQGCAKAGRCLASTEGVDDWKPLPVYYERTEFRTCEFCGCSTNARQRACCEQGRDADRKTTNAVLTGAPSGATVAR